MEALRNRMFTLREWTRRTPRFRVKTWLSFIWAFFIVYALGVTIALALAFPIVATAAETKRVDLNTRPLYTFSCDDPTAREDGTALAPDEIDHVELYISADLAIEPPEPAAVQDGCAGGLVVDMSVYPLGNAYAWMRTEDINGLRSKRSDHLPLDLSRDAPPNPGEIKGVQ